MAGQVASPVNPLQFGCSRVVHAAAMSSVHKENMVPVRPLTEFLCTWSRTYNCTTLSTQCSTSPAYSATNCYLHSHPQDLLTLLHRVEGELGVPREVIVAGLVYADRVKKNAQTALCGYCVTLGCLILALKYLDDEVCQVNKRWAWLAGLDLANFNQLELFVLRVLSCGLFIEPVMFDTWAKALTHELALPWVPQQEVTPSTRPVQRSDNSTDTTPVLVSVPTVQTVPTSSLNRPQVPMTYTMNVTPMTYVNPYGLVLQMPAVAGMVGANQYATKTSASWC
eukprot:comp21328_c0_seq1/m.29220 comp21328_c0_seq1/g.29220  ORF comp21328_c0_seq1/g.29220 comp21328_c0_seq1/m.29220 type:complete len:281 (-) comp21328_c0_seq1:763-1605(-)